MTGDGRDLDTLAALREASSVSPAARRPYAPPAFVQQSAFERLALACTGSSNGACASRFPRQGRGYLFPKGTYPTGCVTSFACSVGAAGQS